MQNVKTFFRMFNQLIQILNKKQKKTAVVIAFLSIISALFETLGVSVILPFILAMLQPETLMQYDKVAFVLNLFNIKTSMGMIIFVGIGVIVVYIVKNAYIMGFTVFKMRFRNRLERDLAVKMLRSYVYKPYSFFLNVNSAEIMRGITSDNSAVATTVDCYCNLVNEGLTCMMLGIVLVVINPFIAICAVGLAALIALLMVLVMRKAIAECSARSRKAFAERYKTSYEPVNGIKEINVMKRQDEFLKKFEKASTVASEANTKYQSIACLPSRTTEVVFITGLVLVVLVAYNVTDDMTVLMAQFSALAVAAMRLLPSISNISNSMNTLVFQRPALESAYDNIVNGGLRDLVEEETDSKEKDDEEVHFENSIDVDSITWRYSDDLPNVLKDLDIEIHKGEAIGFVGESGAGKTTLADILLGLFVPQAGRVTVDGKSIFDEATKWHKLVGYVPQSVFLIDDTVKNNILFGIAEEDADEERLQRAIDQAQMRKFVEKLPQGIDTILGERGVKISGGQRQRIAIARALYYNPEILVLDEATSALDNETEAAVIEAINALQGEKTLIIVAHRLSTIANCDRVYRIENGKARVVDISKNE